MHVSPRESLLAAGLGRLSALEKLSFASKAEIANSALLLPLQPVDVGDQRSGTSSTGHTRATRFQAPSNWDTSGKGSEAIERLSPHFMRGDTFRGSIGSSPGRRRFGSAEVSPGRCLASGRQLSVTTPAFGSSCRLSRRDGSLLRATRACEEVAEETPTSSPHNVSAPSSSIVLPAASRGLRTVSVVSPGRGRHCMLGEETESTSEGTSSGRSPAISSKPPRPASGCLARWCCQPYLLPDMPVPPAPAPPSIPSRRRVSIPDGAAFQLDKLLPREWIDAETFSPPERTERALTPRPSEVDVRLKTADVDAGNSPSDGEGSDQVRQSLQVYLTQMANAFFGAAEGVPVPQVAGWARRAAAESAIQKASLVHLKLKSLAKRKTNRSAPTGDMESDMSQMSQLGSREESRLHAGSLETLPLAFPSCDSARTASLSVVSERRRKNDQMDGSQERTSSGDPKRSQSSSTQHLIMKTATTVLVKSIASRKEPLPSPQPQKAEMPPKLVRTVSLPHIIPPAPLHSLEPAPRTGKRVRHAMCPSPRSPREVNWPRARRRTPSSSSSSANIVPRPARLRLALPEPNANRSIENCPDVFSGEQTASAHEDGRVSALFGAPPPPPCPPSPPPSPPPPILRNPLGDNKRLPRELHCPKLAFDLSQSNTDSQCLLTEEGTETTIEETESAITDLINSVPTPTKKRTSSSRGSDCRLAPVLPRSFFTVLDPVHGTRCECLLSTDRHTSMGSKHLTSGNRDEGKRPDAQTFLIPITGPRLVSSETAGSRTPGGDKKIPPTPNRRRPLSPLLHNAFRDSSSPVQHLSPPFSPVSTRNRSSDSKPPPLRPPTSLPRHPAGPPASSPRSSASPPRFAETSFRGDALHSLRERGAAFPTPPHTPLRSKDSSSPEQSYFKANQFPAPVAARLNDDTSSRLLLRLRSPSSTQRVLLSPDSIPLFHSGISRRDDPAGDIFPTNSRVVASSSSEMSPSASTGNKQTPYASSKEREKERQDSIKFPSKNGRLKSPPESHMLTSQVPPNLLPPPIEAAPSVSSPLTASETVKSPMPELSIQKPKQRHRKSHQLPNQNYRRNSVEEFMQAYSSLSSLSGLVSDSSSDEEDPATLRFTPTTSLTVKTSLATLLNANRQEPLIELSPVLPSRHSDASSTSSKRTDLQLGTWMPVPTPSQNRPRQRSILSPFHAEHLTVPDSKLVDSSPVAVAFTSGSFAKIKDATHTSYVPASRRASPTSTPSHDLVPSRKMSAIPPPVQSVLSSGMGTDPEMGSTASAFVRNEDTRLKSANSSRTLAAQIRFNKSVPCEAIVLKPDGKLRLETNFSIRLDTWTRKVQLSKGKQSKSYSLDDLCQVDASDRALYRTRRHMSRADRSMWQSADLPIALLQITGRVCTLTFSNRKIPLIVVFECTDDLQDFIELLGLHVNLSDNVKGKVTFYHSKLKLPQ
eukprot:Gregarina_sp_Poly_1__133@NODE_102_length_14381_cov_59_883820_g89_i0_p1_GENE_NODE_102_length_14381_cov_59_883820_g89_i0NODE_102_length_14381_cov_59_883820_g89_i0_p1_ORF_typecomplete_len1440_score218_05_NODE_102_length_14381_cov_59_883820_g89_i0656210881